MPELPEVTTIVRELNDSRLTSVKIKHVSIYWKSTIAFPTAEKFCRELEGQAIQEISRRGKWIVFRLTKSTLLVHLRMTGKFVFRDTDPSLHERVRLELSDGRFLCYEDQRKFGRWHLLDDPSTVLANIGIEPLSNDFTLDRFKAILEKSSRPLKALLLDQSLITGLGNIYVDEALWDASLHPNRASNTLLEKEILGLFQAIPKVLKLGIENHGTSLGSANANYFSVSGRRGGHQNHLKVFRKDGASCPRCNFLIIKIRLAQRGTHLCPNCQKETFDSRP